MLRKPAFYLFTGLLLLIGGLLLDSWKGAYYNSQAFFTRMVEERLEAELKQLELDMIPVLDSVATSSLLRFGKVPLLHDYPYFIFRGEKLLIWSDFHFVPLYEQVKGDYVLSLLTAGNSFYLIRKWQSDSQTEVVSLIPLFIDYPLKNKYLEPTPNDRLFMGHQVRFAGIDDPGYPVRVRGQMLFQIAAEPGFVFEHSPFNWLLLGLYTLALVPLLLAGWLFSRQQVRQGARWWLPVYFGAAWVVVKLLLNFAPVPSVLAGWQLFDPRFFTVSWFEYNFADMLVNTLAIFALTWVLFVYYRHPTGRYNYPLWQKTVLGVLLIFVLSLVVNYQYLQLRTIYFNSQISLDITRSLHFDIYRILTLLVFILSGATTAMLFHLLFRRLELIVTSVRHRAGVLLAGSALFLLFTYWANLPVGNLLPVTILLVLVLWWTGIHRTLQQFTQGITLYILLWLVVISATAGWSIVQFEQVRETNRMVRFAQNLAAREDYLAEFMINRTIKAIKEDPSISSRLANPFLNKDFIVKKIRKKYMSRYLERYKVSVFLYNQTGEAIPGYGTASNYFAIKKRYALPENRTEYPNIFLLSQDIRNFTRHYVAFIEMQRYGRTTGYIILDFRQNRHTPQRVYPELLVDHRFAEYQNNEFSYAIFEGPLLVQSSGDLDYRFVDLQRATTANPWFQDGYKHYLLPDFEHDLIVVSAPASLFWQTLSNITFLFAVLMLPVILLLSGLLVRMYLGGQSLSYTLKIQLFLNLAFFVPLILVTGTTLSFITRSFRQTQIDNKLQEARQLAGQINKETDAYLVDAAKLDLLADKLKQLAGFGRFDASVYGTDGRLITSTQPAIFDMGLQSAYLNPHVMVHLIENREARTVEQEHIGKLHYFTSYAVVRSSATNRLLGVLAMPFFGAEKSIEASQREALAMIVNVFVLVFIMALLLTFQTSRWLTAPLLLIKKKMRETSFTGRNQPIAWQSDDEIGELIKEYNRMLEKLEESREALARTQKESAWREVAQQVAHEVKNPLTPMKLTLQKLERAVASATRPQAELVATVKNLLGQLQVLSDIVTSFSEFAKMPLPRNERMDLVAVIREVESVFSGDEKIELQLQLPDRPVYMTGDSKLMNRILANILINAGQSARPQQERVHVRVSLEVKEDIHKVLLAISDDGSGIAAEVRERVFIPRFSTKKEGSGIGLAVARHGVEQMGGTIWFETEEGKGTTFYLQFPLLG